MIIEEQKEKRMGNPTKTVAGKQRDELIMSKGYVLMLDVLGFREFISQSGMSKFLEFWKNLKKEVTQACNDLEEGDEYSLASSDIMFLSDTIVVCFSSKKGTTIRPEMLILFVGYILERIFVSSFKQGVFFRGAISFGDFFCDSESNIAMGTAISEAYEWHESTEWIGTILAPSAKYALEMAILHRPVNGKFEQEISCNFILYRPPFKGNIDYETFVFKWVFKLGDIFLDGLELTSIMEVLSSLSYPMKVIQKYENTLKFVRFILDIDIDQFRSENTRKQIELQNMTVTNSS